MEPALEKVSPDPVEEEAAESLRKKAKFRCLFWLGAGCALLGHPSAAWTGMLILVGFLSCLTWFSLTLDVPGACLAVGAFIGAVTFGIAEYSMIGRVKISSSPRELLSRFD